MQLECKYCGVPVHSDDINISRMVAKCRNCHSVFRFDDELGADTSSSNAAERDWYGKKDLNSIPVPKRYTVNQMGAGLEITYRWFSFIFIFLLFFCIAWDGFLVVWYSLALSGKSRGSMDLVAILFPMIHVAVGVGLTYYTIAGFLNRTIISVKSGELSVRHTPLPWPGNRRIPTSQIEQLYCKERVHHSRSRHSTSTTYTYEVHVLLTNGKQLKLLSGLHEPEEALYLERYIEDHLGIVDRPVTGEM